MIENVQRSFTRKVCILCNIPIVSYEDRMLMFDLERLELRRLRIDLVELFKIVNHFSACNVFNALKFSRNNACYVTRGHRYKLNVCTVNKNNLKFYFTNRIVHVWNSLPDSCFNTNLIATFKRNLCNINLSNFIRGQL
jgi:hypothetical protein